MGNNEVRSEEDQKNIARKAPSIQRQILTGYLTLTIVLVFLMVIAIASLLVTSKGYSKISRYHVQQQRAQEVITAHYQWLELLSESISTGIEFKGSLDPTSCALGKWMAESEGEINSDAAMKSSLDAIVEPHKEIHLTAAELIELSKVSQEEALSLYGSKYKPNVELIGRGLGEISNRYQTIASELDAKTKQLALICKVFLVVTGIGAVGGSIFIGLKISKRISIPIQAVETWSEELASGVDNFQFDSAILSRKGNSREINKMIASFEKMASGIRDNVSVIQRVAEGDLTAYVDIKSKGDSLGRNLYHLVQNNDMMFADLLRVADSVASNAESIAEASENLAHSATAQSAAVEVLSGTIEQANNLAAKNADRASNASEVITGMQQEVYLGKERMDTLVESVDEIKEASEKISGVMKSINDIAFQTNILALNAAVEAARAGAAGKGFAVVADEVRNLSIKSAEAAEQSRILIENTITKTTEGSKLTHQASDTFKDIVERTGSITGIMEEINTSSIAQQDYISEVHEEIAKITSIVISNAAASEQTAAATKEMHTNAAVIKQSMDKFNLRKRQEGKPYIPPEKINDQKFIEEAERNYRLRTGKSVSPR